VNNWGQVKVKVVGRCPTPRKPLKRLERNFYARQLSLSLKSKVLEKICANLKKGVNRSFAFESFLPHFF